MKVMKSHCFVNILALFLQNTLHSLPSSTSSSSSSSLSMPSTICIISILFVYLFALSPLDFFILWEYLSRSLLLAHLDFMPLCSSLRSLVIFQPNYKFFAIRFSSTVVEHFGSFSLLLRCMEMNANQHNLSSRIGTKKQTIHKHNKNMMHTEIALSVSQKWFIMS